MHSCLFSGGLGHVKLPYNLFTITEDSENGLIFKRDMVKIELKLIMDNQYSNVSYKRYTVNKYFCKASC